MVLTVVLSQLSGQLSAKLQKLGKMKKLVWDLILTSPRAISLINITLLTCTHTIVMSQTIIYPNPNPNKKNNQNFGARNPNLFCRYSKLPRMEVGRRPYEKG